MKIEASDAAWTHLITTTAGRRPAGLEVGSLAAGSQASHDQIRKFFPGAPPTVHLAPGAPPTGTPTAGGSPLAQPERVGVGRALRASSPGEPHEDLRRASEQFEALLFREMLRAMVQGSTEGGFFGEGTGTGTWEDLFESGLSESLGGQGGLGIAAQIYRQLEQAARPEKPAQESADIAD